MGSVASAPDEKPSAPSRGTAQLTSVSLSAARVGAVLRRSPREVPVASGALDRPGSGCLNELPACGPEMGDGLASASPVGGRLDK